MAKNDLTAAIQLLTKTVATLGTSLKGMDARLANIEANMVTRQEFQKSVENIATKSDIRNLRKGQREIRADISKLATSTPSIKMFDKLKDKVDRHHPTN